MEWPSAPLPSAVPPETSPQVPRSPEPRPPLQRIDQTLLDRLSGEARREARLRRHHNLHRLPDKVQRFLNALQPGTYVRPHRHCRDEPGSGFECFVVLQGAIGLLVLNRAGEVSRIERLEANGPLKGIELAEGQFHTLVALLPDTVMLELKQGPYEPATDKEFLTRFPAEGTPDAVLQERRWRNLFEPAEASKG
ncbi:MULTISPECIES: WbuC family cupin fold metalloprotein [Aphanothece]|uniref:WbuC family cupin fold metalloprotein n=1 Tax=Aphanothece TaxID=1121 RepID=UPI003984C406